MSVVGTYPRYVRKSKAAKAHLSPNGSGKISGGNLLLLFGGHTWGVSLRLGIACVLSCSDVGIQNRKMCVCTVSNVGTYPRYVRKSKAAEAHLSPNRNGKISGGNLLLILSGHTCGVSLRLEIVCELSYGDVGMQNKKMCVCTVSDIGPYPRYVRIINDVLIRYFFSDTPRCV